MNYTQTGENEWIDTLPDTGRFLDIGAYDGKTFSNTRALLERGWTGVWVEPAAYRFDQAVCNALPGVELVNCLLGDTTRLRSFWYSHGAVSTTEQANMELWKHETTFIPIYVTQVSVDDFMREFPPPYDLVSIDTEGTSLDILKLMTPYLYDTQMIVVEHDGLDPVLEGFREIGRTDNNVILVR